MADFQHVNEPAGNFRFDLATVATKAGTRRVLVAAPVGPALLGRDRLAQMRGGSLVSDTDDAIVQAVRQQTSRVDAVVVRGEGQTPVDRWGLSDALSREEQTECAYYLLRSHLALFRRIAEHGVVLLLAVELGADALVAYDSAAERFTRELEAELNQTESSLAVEARVQHWLAERQAIWTTTRYDDFVRDRLGTSIIAAERQAKQLERMRKNVSQ